MSLQTNTFEKQSSIDDENEGGGALAEATGGNSDANNGGLLSSLADAKSLIQGKLDTLPLGALFKDGKFVFPTDLLNKLKIDNLLNTLKDALKKGLSLTDIFKFNLESIFSNFLSQLKKDANDTWAFLKQAGGTFAELLKDNIKGILLSNIYVTDLEFLQGLIPLATISKKALSYKNNYVRNVCIEHDMPISLAYIDWVLGIKYEVGNPKVVTEALKAAKCGSCNVVFYMMSRLNEGIKELENCYPLPKRYNRKQQEEIRTKYKNIITQTQNLMEGMKAGLTESQLEELESRADYLTLKNRLESTTSALNNLAINKEDEYRKDEMYQKIQSLLFRGKRDLHKIMKYVIVFSYSNLTTIQLSTMIKTFDIDVAAFGTTDTKYGKTCLITKSDVDIMAPIIKPKKNTFLGETSSFTKSTTLIPDVDPKFIYPRNANVKRIYIYLANKNIHLTAMVNKDLYERLRLPVYDTLISNLDTAFSGFYKTGFGKIFTDTVKDIEESCYKYTKSLEPYLYKPSAIEYIRYNDLGRLPTPDEAANSGSKQNSSSQTTSSGTTKNKDNYRADSQKSSSKANLAKAASGKEAKTEIDVYADFISIMSKDEINSNLKSFGLTDQELNIMSDKDKEELLKSKWKEHSKDPNTIVESLSLNSLKSYLSKTTGMSEDKLSSLTKEALLAEAKRYAEMSFVDENTTPATYVSVDDMKRYLRKYMNYKETNFIDKSDIYISSKFTKSLESQRRKIYYPKSFDIVGYDAEGFPIIGYPDDNSVQVSIQNNAIGGWSNKYPNGFPVNGSGLICPIIGYDLLGKAMYGTPVFYTDSDPICVDSRNLPVFAFYKDKAILNDNNQTESDINNLINQNLVDIAKYEEYLRANVNGFLKNSYTKSIKTLKKTNESLEKILKSIKVKPVVGYTENGENVFGQLPVNYSVTTPDGYDCIGYDFNGKIVYEYTEEGKTIIGYKDNDEPKYGSTLMKPMGKDSNGLTIYGFDTKNRPIYGFVKTGEAVVNIKYENDKIISYELSDGTIRRTIGLTADKKPIYDYDLFGNPITSYDANGNTIISKLTKEDCAVRKNELNSEIDDIIDKITPVLQSFVESTYFNTVPSESELKTYIKNNFNSIMRDLEADPDKDLYVSTSSRSYLYNYKVEFERCESGVNVYNRILTENPEPPVIGFDTYNVPVLGTSLISEDLTVDSIPELIFSSKDGSDFGFNASTNKNSEESVLDKIDIDFDTDMEKANAEMIKLVSNPNNIDLVLKLIY